MKLIWLQLKLAALYIKEDNFYCAHKVLAGYVFKQSIISSMALIRNNYNKFKRLVWRLQKMKKPEVGQTLYSLNVGNAARGKPQELAPVKVTKVGRKYFTCHGRPYYIKNWREKTDYMPESNLYSSPQEYKEAKEATKICEFISTTFEYGRNSRNIPLSELKEIERIIFSVEAAKNENQRDD